MDITNIHNDLTELVGNTPLVELKAIEHQLNLKARLVAKIEAMNPGGSAKDRIALAMIEDAERRGVLKPGGTIIEPTSGNTGIGLAWVSRVKGYRLILTMPDTMSVERRSLLKALGAELVLTPGAKGMSGAIEKARQLERDTPGAVIMGQFSNPANPEAHYHTTGPEIWRDTDGAVDVLVAGVGTGGTLCGSARALKERKPSVVAVAVEPSDSPVLSGGKPGPHKLQGIGAGFIPANYDPTVVDRIMAVDYPDSVKAARLLANTEGILAGISSGAALAAAIKLAQEPDMAGKTIVVVLPDTGDRYLSTPLFNAEEYPQG